MKRIVSVVCLFILILAGCSNQETLTGPELMTNHLQILQLPEEDAALAKTRKFKEEINGMIGGQIDFSTEYKTKTGKVKVYGSLVIPPGAFEGTEKITLVIDKKKAVIDLFPSEMTFEIPLKLTITHEGIDLSNLNPDELNFGYIDERSDLFELTISSGKIFDAENGKLGIIEAEIYHFSRWGWVL